MGSSPTPEINSPLTPEQEAQQEATYSRLEKQGMSDQGIVSPEELNKELLSLGSDIKKGFQKKVIDPLMGKSPSASQAGTAREATTGEFKGVSQTKAPTKSLINTSAEEAMAMGLQ